MKRRAMSAGGGSAAALGLAALLAFAPSLAASELAPGVEPEASALPVAARPFFFALSVADVEASAAWYERVFGFELARRIQFEGGQIRLLAREGGFLELVEAVGARDLGELTPETPRRFLLRGVFKIGFEVADLEAAMARLEALDVSLRGSVVTEENGSMHSVQVEDPDGTIVQLFEVVEEARTR